MLISGFRISDGSTGMGVGQSASAFAGNTANIRTAKNSIAIGFFFIMSPPSISEL
jgi:hypothetical protein